LVDELLAREEFQALLPAAEAQLEERASFSHGRDRH
jgi:hypothetical protein